ncbi:MAG: NAD(P)-dependent oxidoreductase [Muribaculaceae bacterium]|nr:NAD(P)-dependent oxidoreductase [Muribaculaceae bacterium]
MNNPKKILIVGAGGFIGGFIAAKALALGYETWVAVRETTSRRYLTDPGLNFITLDYDDQTQVAKALTEALPEGEKWNYIIYNLGATKCANFLDFKRINYTYLRNFVETLKQIDLVPEKFLYMSSLSAIGPYDEDNYTPATSSTFANPNTAYGLSKVQSETYLENISGIPYLIFRPTGVYGPHEKDYLMMIQSIDRHIAFGVGFKKQLLTFIYVEDLVQAMFQALESPAAIRKKYIISEDRAYTQQEFRRIVAEELGRKFVLPVKLPLWALYAASYVAEKWGKITIKPSTLNRDKYKIMKQRNWTADISDARADFNFNPVFDLRKGIHETVKEYLRRKG